MMEYLSMFGLEVPMLEWVMCMILGRCCWRGYCHFVGGLLHMVTCDYRVVENLRPMVQIGLVIG